MARGLLRIYLGAAPGVGKTFAMLNEGWRRASRGTDVVVGFVETHGRANTQEQIRDLEIVPRRTIVYRGTEFEEMDVDAIIARAPRVALVDELAHTNVPGSRNEKRWQDVEEILVAGHRRDLDRQRATPRIDERRRRRGHRDQTARDDPGRRGACGRPDRDRRHDPPGAAAPDGARQHLSARAGRRLARQLLPRGKPRRAARAGADVGGRPGRRGARGLPRSARHLRDVGDARTGGRRDHRRAGGRRRHPPGRPDGGAHPRGAARRARATRRRAARSTGRVAASSNGPCSRSSAASTTSSRAPTPRPRSCSSPGPRTRRRSCSARVASRAGRISSAGR